MTARVQDEWERGTSASKLLDVLDRSKKRRPSLRKCRLFAVACLALRLDTHKYPWARWALEFTERLADEPVPEGEHLMIRAELLAACVVSPDSMFVSDLLNMHLEERGRTPTRTTALLAAVVHEPQLAVARLRDIVGNPFRPVALEPAWLTADVVALARGIYDERAFDRMPILADALQDSGCANEDVLNHCRDPNQTHVRGCWVVDLLLGKT
jgi:hypothetical protein